MSNTQPSFRNLCETLQTIRETRSSNAKISFFSRFLESIDHEKELALAVQFTGEGAFDDLSGKRASVGSRTSGLAAAEFCDIDYDMVFKPCRTATGSSSETIERLMANIPRAIEKRSPVDQSLSEISHLFEELADLSGREDKKECLHEAWSRMSPVEIKYFIRILGQGSLRIGFEKRSVVASIANAFDADREEVRYAHMITGSLGKTAILAKNQRLHEASFRLFHPLSFMLASPVESRSVKDLTQYVAEEKFDGMRAQVHIRGDKVRVFSRDLNDITSTFPDIVSFFAEKNMPAAVLDGEICVYKNEIIQPFQLLQKRMGVKKPGEKILNRYPSLFIAYDLLYASETPVFDLPLTKRREKLQCICDHHQVPVTTQFQVNSFDELDERFRFALKHGNEGLMLKKTDSPYEYGQRRKSWLKVKKPGGSFDTVVMYAHAGSGKRGGTYSDFTLGISVKNDERYEEEFIPIGKAYGGYTDDELRKMNARIKKLAVERYGPTLGLIPELIVEIEFDDIQVNKRTKAGYTLRLPRFKAIRWDLGPSDVNTLEDVEEFYAARLNEDRLPQHENPSFTVQSS